MTARSYRLHGLRVVSEVALPEPEAPLDGDPDLDVVVQDARPVHPFPDDGLILRHVRDRQILYEARSVSPARLEVQAPGFVHLALESSTLHGHAAPTAPDGALSLILAGTGLSFFLAMQGRLVLHASAVEVGGACVAFAGMSGQGKTTLAAAAGAMGHRLFADDVLRVDLADGALAHRGASQVRLRRSPLADEIASRLPSHVTVDDRIAVAPVASTADRLPLRAVVFPKLQRSPELSVRLVDRRSALVMLLDSPRLLGWLEPIVLQREFALLVDLAATVPVFEAVIPWAEPTLSTTTAAVEATLRTVLGGSPVTRR